MPDRPQLGSVDTARERSISFATPDPRSSRRPFVGRPGIPVGPGRAAGETPSRSAHLSDEGSAYPIQIAKVQRPALRDETLERPRLLDWLRTKIHGRVVLVLADAGYGKTTLLADYSRRTRTRILWYRLDPDDRDWVTILHHLVAAGLEHDPEFGGATLAALADVGAGGGETDRDGAVATFIGELPRITEAGAVLIFDDFHLVDDAPDARYIARELVARAPERTTLVFASRRAPTIPLSKLRSVGEVAELNTDDLRFDGAETTQLFTETYGRTLDSDVLHDLALRTEGWIASLQLVHAALRDRSPVEIRRFVRTLNGADHDLYDYLAEEVVGDLEGSLQRFLMETAILQVVTPHLACAVTGRSEAEVAELMASAERLTLLSRLSGAPRTHRRYHPLVRGFLEARLRATDGPDVVATLHIRAAAAAAPEDWRIGAYHYREAGDIEAMLGLVAAAIPTIMGKGQYALAEGFIGPISADGRPAGFALILSRVDMQQGDYESATSASQAVLDSELADAVQRDHALLNLVTLATNYGDGDRAVGLAQQLAAATSDSYLRALADALVQVLTVENASELEAVNRRLRALAETQRETRSYHFGVTMLNLAMNSLVQDRVSDAHGESTDALEALLETSGSVEQSAARVLLASINLRLGRNEDAEGLLKDLEAGSSYIPDEAIAEAADAFDSFGSHTVARRLLSRIGDGSAQTLADRRSIAVSRARMAIRTRDIAVATEQLNAYPTGLPTVVGAAVALQVTKAHLAMIRGDRIAPTLLAAANQAAATQGALALRRVSELLLACTRGPDEVAEAVMVIGHGTPWHLTFVAEDILPFLERLPSEALGAIRKATDLHPARWRTALRQAIDTDESDIGSAQLLEEVGERSDIARLRRVARVAKKRTEVVHLGRSLARRLADHVYVEDQGRISIEIGSRAVLGSAVRRKVLAMLTYLISRPDLSATRDQVLDALWPELDPEIAVNSLNQTVYFLRRVLEESYSDDTSPGYVHHDSDVLWLDPDLVTSRSVECRRLIRSLPPRPNPDEVDRLINLYAGRFALDFEYEEWAAAYRDTLHAAYLEIVERSVLDDFSSGHYDRGIRVARRALEVDPTAEQVEVCLLRLYRVTGAHAAAAEQYEHYAASVRDEIGVEPPPLEAL